jgi:hypothetical protein
MTDSGSEATASEEGRGRCLVHDAPGEGVCAQCGRVVCAVCRRSREGLLVCDGCQPFTRESQVLSGASLLATLLLFIAPLRFLQTLAHAWDGLRERSIEVLLELEAREWVLLTLGQLATRGVVTMIAVVALKLAFARRTGAPRWMLAVFVTGLIADLSWRSVAGPLDAPAVALLAAPLCVTVGWAWLLLTSARVSRTFVH